MTNHPHHPADENASPEDPSSIPEAPVDTFPAEDGVSLNNETVSEPVVDIEPVLEEEEEVTDTSDEIQAQREALLEPSENVNLRSPMKSELDDKIKAKFTVSERLGVISANIVELTEILKTLPADIDPENNPADQQWVNALDTGESLLYRGDALASALNDLNSAWQQHVTYNNTAVAAARPRLGDTLGEKTEVGHQLLVGERALQKLRGSLGIGATIQVPLWHTGLWVTIRAPSDKSLLELNNRISLEKVNLGRFTNGMIYSNHSIYTQSYVFRFALEHVYDTTLKDTRKENMVEALMDVIKTTDIPALIWGLVCTIYPSGYPFSQPCVTNPSVCRHVTEALLNLSKIYIQNDRAFSDYQRKHMANRNSRVTLEQLARYEEDMPYNINPTFAVTREEVPILTVEMKVPTLKEYEQSGFEWVDTIVQQTDRAFGEDLQHNERDKYIINQGKVSALRQYGHWVKRLVYDDDSVVENRASIEESIEVLSADDDIRQLFFSEVGKYIDRCSLTMVAVPRWDCPKCGKPMNPESTLHPHLIPLDMVRIFFTLLDQRLTKVISRSAITP